MRQPFRALSLSLKNLCYLEAVFRHSRQIGPDWATKTSNEQGWPAGAIKIK